MTVVNRASGPVSTEDPVAGPSTGSATGSGQQIPLLFLISDTGGGHRSAAKAVSQALERNWPGRFTAVIHDPLRTPEAPRRLRWLVALYGPGIRLAPWFWGLLWHITNSRPVFWLSERMFLAPADAIVASAVAAHRPALIVSFHPFTGRPATRVRDSAASAPLVPVVTVITDLVTPHITWRRDLADRVIVPSATVRDRCHKDEIAEDRVHDLGLPVAAQFSEGPLPVADRGRLQRSLGASGSRFLVVVAGGAEGSGGLARRAAALIRRLPEVEVAVICGHNHSARRTLERLAARSGGRLLVKGFVDNMAEWLRCADILVTKAGPGTIAEATCCGAPLILTSFVPGQERGNVKFVVEADAGRSAPTLRKLVAQIDELRRDPAALAAMRAAAVQLGRPRAAADVADLLVALVPAHPQWPAVVPPVSADRWQPGRRKRRHRTGRASPAPSRL